MFLKKIDNAHPTGLLLDKNNRLISPILFLSLILLVALALRLPGYTESIWFDELWSTHVMLGSFHDFLRTAWYDIHPPGYNAFMFLWIQVFGDSEISIRLPPLLAGLLTIVLSYKIAHRVFGYPTALLTALFLALSPTHIWYSQEARPYSFLIFSLVLSIYSYLKYSESENHSKWLVLYFASLLYAAFIHYYVVPYIGMISLLTFRKWDRKNKRIFLANLIIISLLGCYILAKIYLGTLATSAGYLRNFDLFEIWMIVFNWFTTGNAIWPVEWWTKKFIILIDNPLMLVMHTVFALLLLHGIISSLRTSMDTRRDFRLDLLALLLSLPLLLLFMTLIGLNHISQERSYLTMMPLFFMFIAYGINSISLHWLRVGAMLIAGIFMVTGLINYYEKSDQWTVYKPNPDWKSATRYLAEEMAKDQSKRIVLTTAPSNVLSYYDGRFSITETFPHVDKQTNQSEVYPVLFLRKASQLPRELFSKDLYLIHLEFWTRDYNFIRDRLQKCTGRSAEVVKRFKGIDILKFVHTRNSTHPPAIQDCENLERSIHPGKN